MGVGEERMTLDLFQYNTTIEYIKNCAPKRVIYCEFIRGPLDAKVNFELNGEPKAYGENLLWLAAIEMENFSYRLCISYENIHM